MHTTHRPADCPRCNRGRASEYVTLSVNATQHMPIAYDGRSLGAHMDTTNRRRGTTLTRRMTAGAAVCKRIEQLPLSLDNTVHLITTNSLSGATYGCECTTVNVAAARRLRTAIAGATVGKHYGNSAPEVLLQASGSKILDPDLKVLDSRIIALRRGIHKNTRRGPTTLSCVQRLLQHYTERGDYMMGGAQALQAASVAPPYASKDRDQWAMKPRPAGPIALLLESLGTFGLTADVDLNIWGGARHDQYRHCAAAPIPHRCCRIRGARCHERAPSKTPDACPTAGHRLDADPGVLERVKRRQARGTQ